VDDAVGCGRSFTQAFQVFKTPAMYLSAGGGEGLGARIRASETEHLMARTDEFLYDGRTDESRCSRNKNFHIFAPSHFSR
jgi:hypothetical protein